MTCAGVSAAAADAFREGGVANPGYPSGHDAEGLWQAALCELREQMLAVTYDQWVRGGVVLASACTPTFLVIVAPGDAARQWLTYRLYPVIARTTGYLAGGPVTLCFISRQRGNGRLGTAMRLPEMAVGEVVGDDVDFSQHVAPTALPLSGGATDGGSGCVARMYKGV